MKDDDSISWISGEGSPSRDYIGQVEERTEAAAGGFQLIEARGKCSVVQVFCTCTQVSVEKATYVHDFVEGKVCTPRETC
jgi:hypothetical protein